MVMMVEDDGGESNNLRGATIQKLNEAGVWGQLGLKEV